MRKATHFLRKKAAHRLELTPAELEKRAAAWVPPQPNYTSGVMYKYARTAYQADDGAVTNVPNK